MKKLFQSAFVLALFSALVTLTSSTAFAQTYESPYSSKLYGASVASLVSANALDAASSFGMKEGNPLLGTRFNGRSLAIKSGLVGAGLVGQYFVLRRHPERRRTAAIVNFAMSGVLAAVAMHNFGIRSGR